MTPDIRFRPEALSEWRDAHDRYERHAPGLGLDFSRRVEAAVLLAAETPLRFARVRGDVRRVLLRRFPYAVYFASIGAGIEVLAVFHLARDPGEWRRRR